MVPDGLERGQGVGRVAVLFSAGLDSAVLLAQAAHDGTGDPLRALQQVP